MNELELAEMVSNNNGQPMTDSRRIAKYFEKEHKHVLRDIENLICSNQFRQSNYGPSSYLNSQNKTQPEYMITKNGFLYLAMGYNSEKAAIIKEKYIEAFDRMEQIIAGRSIKSTNPDVEAFVSLQSYLGMAALLGASTSLSRAMAVQHINRTYNLDLKPLLAGNVSDIQEPLIIATEIGKLYGVSACVMNRVLARLELQAKIEKHWELTDLGKEHGGVYVDTGKKHSNGTSVQQIKWYKNKIIKFLKGHLK
jgi:Rha family phage regulatory protein